VGIVTEKEPRDVAETETRLFLRRRVFADVVVGHGALGRDHSEAIRVVGGVSSRGGGGHNSRGQCKGQGDGPSANGW
jgi:hypothetical protein